VIGEPRVVRTAGQPDHRGRGASGQLNRDRPDPAGGTRDDDGIARTERHRVRGGTGDIQRAGRLPGHAARPVDQVLLLDDGVVGVAGPLVGEPDHLVPDREPVDAVAELRHDPGQVAALPRREPPGVRKGLYPSTHATGDGKLGFGRGNRSESSVHPTRTLTSLGALYFCVPHNEKLVAYWDTVEDPLFKIRHCQNVEGSLASWRCGSRRSTPRASYGPPPRVWTSRRSWPTVPRCLARTASR
jgi:hypothetical protein